jgi:hypothetical protein
MPQTNLNLIAKNPSNVNVPLTTDATGNLFVGSGSVPRYNITAATVVKATPGRLVRIAVSVAPTAAALVASDCATTGAVAASNQIVSVAFGSLTAGQVITLDWPCTAGIVINPGTGGTVSVSFD